MVVYILHIFSKYRSRFLDAPVPLRINVLQTLYCEWTVLNWFCWTVYVGEDGRDYDRDHVRRHNDSKLTLIHSKWSAVTNSVWVWRAVNATKIFGPMYLFIFFGYSKFRRINSTSGENKYESTNNSMKLPINPLAPEFSFKF